MEILLFTKDSEVERLGFAVRNYVRYIHPFLGLTKKDRDNLPNLDYKFGIGFLYPYKIPKAEVERKSWINFHPGLLPAYGGRNVAYHAIMNGESHFGGTVHLMDENFYTGAIISRRAFWIEPEHTAGDLNEKAIDCLYQELDWVLYRLINRMNIPLIKQENVKYYPAMNLDEQIMLADNFEERKLRALTTKTYSAKIHLDRQKYNVSRDAE